VTFFESGGEQSIVFKSVQIVKIVQVGKDGQIVETVEHVEIGEAVQGEKSEYWNIGMVEDRTKRTQHTVDRRQHQSIEQRAESGEQTAKSEPRSLRAAEPLHGPEERQNLLSLRPSLASIAQGN
jgi:hypothetical protein